MIRFEVDGLSAQDKGRLETLEDDGGAGAGDDDGNGVVEMDGDGVGDELAGASDDASGDAAGGEGEGDDEVEDCWSDCIVADKAGDTAKMRAPSAMM